MFDTNDANITPNIDHKETVSYWKNNKGIKNTVVGGLKTITVEATTTIGMTGQYYDIAGTWTMQKNEHFDTPTNGQLRYIGKQEREFILTGNFVLRGTSNDRIDLQFTVNRDATGLDESIYEIERIINNNAGARDVAYFGIGGIRVTLNENDYIRAQVENYTGANDITAEVDSYFNLVELS